MSETAINHAKAASAGSENCLPVGTRLAEFEIQGIVGEGGFGIVYIAFDHSLQRTVAIKEYMPAVLAARTADSSVTVRSKQHQETFDKGLKSFINEARLLAQFDHPALIKVYRFWEQNNTGYMAMRYYEGRTLKSIVAEDPSIITEVWLKSILAPVLEALDTLYRMKILHRDISPDNIMVQSNGEAVLLDFGAARQIITDITQSLTVILKPGYAPVEQYADDEAMTQGAWTDIYSLCAVIYFAIKKKPPATSVGRMIKDPMEPLQNGDYPGFSKQFLAAIDKGLGIRPEERPQTIDEFRRLLGLAGGEKVVPIPLKVVPPKTSSKSGERRHGEKVDRRKVAESSKPRKTVPLVYKGLWAGGVLIFASLLVAGVVKKKPAEMKLAEAAAPKQPAVAAAPVADESQLEWERLSAKSDATQADFEAYVGKYPSGKNTETAKARIVALQLQTSTPPVSIAQKAEPEKIEPPTGVVKLIIKPWGNVSVDGVAKGVSPPLKRLVLPAGKHQVTIDNPNFKSHVVTVDVAQKKPVNIDFDFSTN
ncbi:MAG: phosphotransferase enzyme family protein [Paucimonas sp.]|nr:phosphotransferase enzyme family protein [Paucimonas sp.]